MAERWALFVDESGPFDGERPSLVAGLLAPADARALDRGGLRAALADLWGPAPWPPHAALLRVPASRVLHRLVPGGMAPGRFAARLDAPCRPLLDALDTTPFAPRLAELRDGARPTRGDIDAADAALRARRELREPYAALRELCRLQAAAMDRLVARVAERLGGLWLLAALADRAPPGPEAAPGRLRDDAYTRALEVVLERAVRLAPAGEVEAWVLTRHVAVGGLGDRVPMQGHLVRQLAERVSARAALPTRLTAQGGVLPYHDDAEHHLALHPMLVLADHLASAARRHLGWTAAPWAGVVADLAAQGVVPAAALARAPARIPALGPLPTLAAADPFEAHVRAALAGEAPPPLPERPAWAADQARAWAATAGRWA